MSTLSCNTSFFSKSTFISVLYPKLIPKDPVLRCTLILPRQKEDEALIRTYISEQVQSMIQYIIVTPEGQVRDPGTINILKQAIVEDIVNNPEKSWAFIRFMLDQCVLCKAKPAPMAEMNLSDSTELTQLTSSQPDRLQDNDAYVL